MLASIIVCARNHLNDLTVPCLEAIRRNTAVPYELICIDDGSADGTYEFFQTVTDKAHRFERSRGAGYCRNLGMASAGGDLFAFLDNDAFVSKGWLRRICGAYTKTRVGIAAGIPSNETWRLNLPRSPDGLIDVHDVGGACMTFSRAVFRRLGFLDGRLGYCGEDTDYCYRAILAGFRVVSVPDVIVEHRNFGTRRDVDQKRIERSRETFRRKWRPYSHFLPVP